MQNSLAENVAEAVAYMDEGLSVALLAAEEPEGQAQLSDVATETTAAAPFAPAEPLYAELYETVRESVVETGEELADSLPRPLPETEGATAPSSLWAGGQAAPGAPGGDAFTSAVVVAETIVNSPPPLTGSEAATAASEQPTVVAAPAATPNIHIEFSGDIHREADLDALLDRLENRLRAGLFSGTDLSYVY